MADEKIKMLIEGIETRDVKLEKIRNYCEDLKDTTAITILKILDGEI